MRPAGAQRGGGRPCPPARARRRRARLRARRRRARPRAGRAVFLTGHRRRCCLRPGHLRARCLRCPRGGFLRTGHLRFRRLRFRRLRFRRLRFRRSRLHCPRPGCHGGAHLRREDLAAQRALDQPDRAGGGGEPGAFLAVGGQHGVDGVRRQRACELGSHCAVPLPRALHACSGVIPGHGGQRDWVASQDSVQAIVGRHDVEQPAHGGGLEVLAARRMYPGWPSRRRIRCHETIIPRLSNLYSSCGTPRSH